MPLPSVTSMCLECISKQLQPHVDMQRRNLRYVPHLALPLGRCPQARAVRRRCWWSRCFREVREWAIVCCPYCTEVHAEVQARLQRWRRDQLLWLRLDPRVGRIRMHRRTATEVHQNHYKVSGPGWAQLFSGFIRGDILNKSKFECLFQQIFDKMKYFLWYLVKKGGVYSSSCRLLKIIL